MFQDEELLFSQSQQKDNDPDVDLFSTPEKAAVSRNPNIYLPFLGIYDYILFFHCIVTIHFMTVVFLELQVELNSEASSTRSVFR